MDNTNAIFRPKRSTTLRTRQGAIIPLFAIALPVLLMLCAFAINVAYIQLTTTELRIATDAAARAGGRAFSVKQTVSDAKNYAKSTAALNIVAGAPLVLNDSDAAGEIEFGISVPNAAGRYQFTKKNTAAVAAGTEPASSIRINRLASGWDAGGPLSLMFMGIGTNTNFRPESISVATQLDRDVALVLDQSGSMAYSTFEDGLWAAIYAGYSNGYLYWSEVKSAMWGYEGNNTTANTSGKSLYNRYSNWWVRNWLLTQYGGAGGQNYYEYVLDMNAYTRNGNIGGSPGGPAPRHSRWDLLVQGVEAFLDVLDATDQEEQVALVTFNTVGYSRHALTKNFTAVSNTVDAIIPYSGTDIGEGMEDGFTYLQNTLLARPYAAKTIIVLTDGVHNGDVNPITAASTIVSQMQVTIHTMTFTPDADQTMMATVAATGQGKHYHSNDGAKLISDFEEIANNLPTLVTQ